MPVPKNDKEAAESYLKIAKQLGFDLTIDEIVAGLKTAETKTAIAKNRVFIVNRHGIKRRRHHFVVNSVMRQLSTIFVSAEDEKSPADRALYGRIFTLIADFDYVGCGIVNRRQGVVIGRHILQTQPGRKFRHTGVGVENQMV